MKLSLSNLNKHYKGVLVTAIAICTLVIVQPFLWIFVQKKAVALHDSRSQEQQIANTKDRNATIKHNLGQEREFLSQLDVVVPPRKMLTQVVERLEQLADQRYLSLKITNIKEDLSDAKTINNTTLIPVTATLTVEGTINQVFDYLASIEHIQELTVLTAWKVLPNEKAPVQSVAPGVPTPTPSLTRYTLSADILFYLRGESNEPNE